MIEKKSERKGGGQADRQDDKKLVFFFGAEQNTHDTHPKVDRDTRTFNSK